MKWVIEIESAARMQLATRMNLAAAIGLAARMQFAVRRYAVRIGARLPRALDPGRVGSMPPQIAAARIVPGMNGADPVLILKRQLAREIASLAAPVHQIAAAYTFGVDQPLISRLVHGQVDRVSLDRLIRMLHHVGRPVTLTVATGPRIRFRFTPPGYLGRFARLGSADAASSSAVGPVANPLGDATARPRSPWRTPLARKRFERWLESG